MRHSRAEEFERARATGTQPVRRGRWTEAASDPNHPGALAHRSEALRAAWRPPITDRISFLQERCRDRRVLDIGCVAHDVGRMSSPGWLHARIAQVATRCIGVDVLAEGVEAMRHHGYEAIEHDLGTGLGPLAAEGPFDVIVAGELIEHVASIDMLFRTAAEALAPGGELIITTPNPYAPHRVRAAQLGIVWENVDHILYAFPSGVAELCERHGLRLAEAMVTDDRTHPRGLDRLRSLRRRLRGRQWMSVGYSTFGERRVQRVGGRRWGVAARRLLLPRRSFLGETFVYVVRPAST